ncbi:MAG: class D beta-lactamase [Saprospiraceae bacterium]
MKKIDLHLSVFLIATFFFMGCESVTKDTEKSEWKTYFDNKNVKGTIVIRDLESSQQWIYNSERAKTGFLPASTFKIMNSMIALETEILSTEDTIYWNGENHRIPTWRENHVLKTAFSTSCVPCYQEIARKVGVQRMNKHIKANDYGQMDIQEENLDMFWLVGNSKITPLEQVDFIEKLYKNKLTFSQKTIDSIKEIMLNEKGNDFVLYGKTGWAQIEAEQINLGWFVGYLTSSKGNYAFATNIERPMPEDTEGFAAARKEITMEIFEKMLKK